MTALSDDQLGFFADDGYLILENLFTGDEVRALRQEADYLLELILNSSLMHERVSGRLDWRQNSQGTQIVRKIQPVNDLSLAFTRAIEDERIVASLRQIMGDEPVLMEEKLNYKQPLSDTVEGLPVRPLEDDFPIHNDWAYYQAQNYPQTGCPRNCCWTTAHQTTALCASGPVLTKNTCLTSASTTAWRYPPISLTTRMAWT